MTLYRLCVIWPNCTSHQSVQRTTKLTTTMQLQGCGSCSQTARELGSAVTQWQGSLEVGTELKPSQWQVLFDLLWKEEIDETFKRYILTNFNIKFCAKVCRDVQEAFEELLSNNSLHAWIATFNRRRNNESIAAESFATKMDEQRNAHTLDLHLKRPRQVGIAS